MKRRKFSFLLTLIMCFATVFSSFTLFTFAAESGTDNAGPDIKLDTLSIEKTSPELNEHFKIGVQVTDASEILRVELLYANVDNGYGATASYNSMTGKYEFDIYTPVYGANEVVKISAKDIYGNETVYVDKASQYYSKWPFEGNDADFSALDFKVNTSVVNDNAGPDINLSSMKISKNNPELNEKVTLSIKANDPTGIMNFELLYVNADNGYGSTGVYNSITGYYDFEMYSPVYGENEIVFFRAKDLFGNTTQYVDKTSQYYSKWPFEGIDVDLSKGDFCVAGVEDKEAPMIDIASIRITDNVVKLNQKTILSVKATDNVGIMNIVLLYVNADNGYGATGTYNSETGYYDFEMYSPVYGENEIAFITAKDTSGNIVRYVDKNIKRNQWSNWDNSIETNLKAGQFYACLKDEDTGVCVSNSAMDGSTILEVTAREKSGEEYNKLHNQSLESISFYDITVKGNANMSFENSIVFFDLSKYNEIKDGDKVVIKHLKHDGAIQESECIVKNKMIEMEVNEFSPFLLEKSNDSTQKADNALDKTNVENKANVTIKTDNPETGDINESWLYILLIFLSIMLSRIVIKNKVNNEI